MQSGELLVTGKGTVEIILKRYPQRVTVDFKDKYIIVPCNPHHHDELSYEVHHSHHHGYRGSFVLKIKWDVTGVREIKWHAYY